MSFALFSSDPVNIVLYQCILSSTLLSIPDPSVPYPAVNPLLSLLQEWVTVGRTLAQVALCQLITVTSLSLDCVDSRAHSLGLMGKCLRLLAMQKDPLYPYSLWDGHNLVEAHKHTHTH